jgi:4-alpha-glucanotransferase
MTTLERAQRKRLPDGAAEAKSSVSAPATPSPESAAPSSAAGSSGAAGASVDERAAAAEPASRFDKERPAWEPPPTPPGGEGGPGARTRSFDLLLASKAGESAPLSEAGAVGRPSRPAAIAEALKLLGVESFVLSIHDPSFPSDPGEDPGRGTPYGNGARRFLSFARELGFNGIQLGPQGLTAPGNTSPYDGTAFSRNPLNVSLARLVDDGLLSRGTLDEIVSARPPGADKRAADVAVHAAYDRVFREVHDAFVARGPEAKARLAGFMAESERWLVRDALWAVLAAEHGPVLSEWPKTERGALDARLFARGAEKDPAAKKRLAELVQQHAGHIERHALAQMLVRDQHQAFRKEMRDLGLKVYGDFQIGYAAQDVWAWGAAFLEGYRMGAPPSRTNPEGQPWNYPVLDPALYFDEAGGPGPAMELFRARFARMLEDYDAIRIDHPHGLVTPWVYRADAKNPKDAVKKGARLFSSPSLPDHPELAKYAIATKAQIDCDVPRYADAWEHDLDDDQVRRYGALFDQMMESFIGSGRDKGDLLVEVLSTLPHPLSRVLEKHGVGRFRVTQKAAPGDPHDVYSTSRANPADWVMVGNHDTKPIWTLIDEWRKSGRHELEADALAARLGATEEERAQLRDRFADPGNLAEAKLAELFTSRAKNVMLFFADLFGDKEVYNTPGTISDLNWSLRVDPSWATSHEERAAGGRALSVPRALALALRARGADFVAEHAALIDQLESVEPSG